MCVRSYESEHVYVYVNICVCVCVPNGKGNLLCTAVPQNDNDIIVTPKFILLCEMSD